MPTVCRLLFGFSLEIPLFIKDATKRINFENGDETFCSMPNKEVVKDGRS